MPIDIIAKILGYTNTNMTRHKVQTGTIQQILPIEWHARSRNYWRFW